MARYFSPYAMPEPWVEPVMRCSYCGTSGRDFKCRSCGASVSPDRPTFERDVPFSMPAATTARSSRREMTGPPVMNSESVFVGDDWGR
jgi:tRNA(Ile2) C34 agmatinyltransferase TiaS